MTERHHNTRQHFLNAEQSESQGVCVYGFDDDLHSLVASYIMLENMGVKQSKVDRHRSEDSFRTESTEVVRTEEVPKLFRLHRTKDSQTGKIQEIYRKMQKYITWFTIVP